MMTFLQPELLMAGGILVSLLAAMFWPSTRASWWTGLVFTLAALVRAFTLYSPVAHYWLGAIIGDNYSLIITMMVALATAAGLLLAWNSESYGPEYPALVMLAGTGGMVMGFAANLILLFLGLELLSLPLYILAASHRTGPGGEAGLKYLLVGAFSSGILLFGMALIYGATGTMSFVSFSASEAVPGLVAAGLALVLAGLTYKLAIVPFHMWVPDVYEGSPTPVTAFMAFGTKVGAAAGLLRFLAFGFPLSTSWWGILLGYLAVLTMLGGNLLALPQRNLKRLLAWSGIGNAGYVLVGMAAHDIRGAEAAIFYLLPYGLAILLAFGVLTVLEDKEGTGVDYEQLKGVAYRHPWLAAGFVVSMLSLAGIPLTAGFVGKFYLIQGALAGNQWGLAVGLVLATVVGLAAYFRPVQAMFTRGEGAHANWSAGSAIVVGVAAVATLFLGLYPQPVFHLVTQSARFIWLH
jgi:NADH-quinone oxidoreductase subunit N